MKTAEYPHVSFLRKNNIDVEKLPKLIKQRINGFEEIQETLPYLVEEDQPVIEETLQKLSFEIEEDLEEEFEELLENNEIDEEPVPVEEAKEDENDEQDDEDFVPELEPEAPTPEKALEAVYDRGVRQLNPAELKELGIPIPNKRVQTVGSFCLIKGRYKNCYTLVLRQEKVKEE